MGGRGDPGFDPRALPAEGRRAQIRGQARPDERVSQWSADGRTLFVSHFGDRLDVFGIDVQSGGRTLWKTIEVPDPAGVHMYSFIVTPDARSYAYGYMRILDELYLVEGLK